MYEDSRKFTSDMNELSFYFASLQLTKFTKMNVWTHFIYWSGKYPTGPDDRICSSPGKLKRNVTGEVFQPFPGEPDDENLC